MRPCAQAREGVVGLRPGVVHHPVEGRVQVLGERSRVVEQDVGVELAPAQLGDEPAVAVGVEAGQQRPGMDLAPAQRQREPARAGEVGAVAQVAVVGQVPVGEARPTGPWLPPRRPRAGTCPAAGSALGSGSPGRSRTSIRAGRRVGAAQPASSQARWNGVNTRYGRAVGLADRSRRHGVVAPGGDQPGALGRQGRGDPGVALAAPWRVRLGHVHGERPELLGQGAQHLGRITGAHVQGAEVRRAAPPTSRPGTPAVAPRAAATARGRRRTAGRMAAPAASVTARASAGWSWVRRSRRNHITCCTGRP